MIILYEREYNDNQVSIANSTSRSSGASALNKDGSIRSITARYVSQTSDKDESILDFGAGEDAVQTKALIDQGFQDVTAYDFGGNVKDGLHDPNALSKTYDTVFASNVLNVSSDEETLRNTLLDIWDSVSPAGRAVFNYPQSPRKSGMTADQVYEIIGDTIGKFPTRVGGTKSAPIWEISK